MLKGQHQFVLRVQNPDPSLEIQEKLHCNLTEHREDLKIPIGQTVASSPKMFSHLEPAQAFEDSLKDKVFTSFAILLARFRFLPTLLPSGWMDACV